MRSRVRARVLLGLVVLGVLTLNVVGAQAQQFHGIAFAKACDSPTSVGAPYNCSYAILNVVDTGQDTVAVTGLTDQVHAASGDVNSGNILPALQLVFTGGATCTGGTGAGTAASPYVGATSCLLPFNATITTNSHSFYTVQAADFGLPANELTDTATLSWHNPCTAPGIQNCTTAPELFTAGSSTVVLAVPSTT